MSSKMHSRDWCHLEMFVGTHYDFHLKTSSSMFSLEWFSDIGVLFGYPFLLLLSDCHFRLLCAKMSQFHKKVHTPFCIGTMTSAYTLQSIKFKGFTITCSLTSIQRRGFPTNDTWLMIESLVWTLSSHHINGWGFLKVK